MKLWFLLVALLFSSNSFAENYFCKKELEVLPILQGGRVKPLFVHASETIKALTGKSSVGDLSAVQAYCLISLNGMGLPTEVDLKARVDHVDAMKFLGLPEGEHEISYNELLKRENDIQTEARMSKDNESYKTTMTKLFNNIYTYKDIKSGTNWLFAETAGNEIQWQPIRTKVSF